MSPNRRGAEKCEQLRPLFGRELRPELHELSRLRVATDPGDAVEVALADPAQVVLPLDFFRVTGDSGHRPRVLQHLAEVLHRVATEGLEEVLPRGDLRPLEDRREAVMLVAVAVTVNLGHRHDEVPARSLGRLEQVEEFRVEWNQPLLAGLGDRLGQGQHPAGEIDHLPCSRKRLALAEPADALEGEEAPPSLVRTRIKEAGEELAGHVVPTTLDLPGLGADAGEGVADENPLVHGLVEEAADVPAVVGNGRGRECLRLRVV
ncbi:MAG: hypothetical protein IT436_17620 [Phycisphaerales bacterium]|nr:hypothetical protein [Phycisphaerales bacterium]